MVCPRMTIGGERMLIQLLISGLAMGCIYALIALGFVLIHNASGAVNFAQGDLVMMGGFLVASSLTILQAPFWVTGLVAMGAVTLLGYAFQLLAYKPLQGKPFVTVFISTIGIGIAMQNIALIVWGPEPRALPPVVSGVNRFGGIVVSNQDLFIMFSTVVVLIALYVLFNGTNLGRMLRATAQDPETARLMGIRTGTMITLTFVLSALVAGYAGFLVAPVIYLSSHMGGHLILKSFIAVVIGGFDSLVGAIAGGIMLGLIEILAAGYISSTYKDVLTFLVLIGFLIVRPQGIFGETIQEKV
jgi:branched-chain amino acid transport system permease protein